MNNDILEGRGLLKTLIQSSIIAWLQLDSRGICVSANEVFEQSQPLARPLGQHLNKIFGQCYGPTFIERTQSYFDEVFSGNPVLFKERVVCDSKVDNLEFYCVPVGHGTAREIFIFIKSNCLEGTLVTNLLGDISRLEHEIQQKNIQLGLSNKKEDITDRKNIEDDLRKLSQAVEQSLCSIMITNKFGSIEYINPNFTKLTGYTMDEVVGNTPKILKSGKHDKEFYANLWDTIVAGEKWQGEVCNRKKNGDLYWESQCITPLKNENGMITGYISVRLDDTRRKIAEEELILHKNHLERLVHEKTKKLIETYKRLEYTQSFAIIMTTHVGLDGRWLKVPYKLCELVGYAEEELTGHSSEQITHPDDFLRDWSQCQRLINKEIKSFDLEKRYIHKNGETVWVYLNCSVVEDESGTPLHFLTYIRDITQQKKNELELKRYIEASAQAEKIYALGKLAGSIAHEFNNPLYGILNILEQFKENPRLVSEEQDLLHLGIKACNSMADMVRRLQDFYRPSTDQETTLDIGALIRNAIPILNKRLGDKKIKLETRFADKLPKTRAVADQLKQVILNLVQNAEEAISHDQGLIQIATELEKKSIKITIRDNGCGIPRENIKPIFEPFFSSKGVKGTGLGLSISHEIIRKHGGVIEVDSTPDVGSTFTITLPGA